MPRSCISACTLQWVAPSRPRQTLLARGTISRQKDSKSGLVPSPVASRSVAPSWVSQAQCAADKGSRSHFAFSTVQTPKCGIQGTYPRYRDTGWRRSAHFQHLKFGRFRIYPHKHWLEAIGPGSYEPSAPLFIGYAKPPPETYHLPFPRSRFGSAPQRPP
jgi:hypothetical protein